MRYPISYITKITYPCIGCGVPGALFLWTGWFAFALQTLESEADLERLSSPPECEPLRELNGLVAEPLVVFRGAWLGLKVQTSCKRRIFFSYLFDGFRNKILDNNAEKHILLII